MSYDETQSSPSSVVVNAAPVPLCAIPPYSAQDVTKRKRRNAAPTSTFPCSSCDVIFTTAFNLRRHVESVHLKLDVTCPLCDTSFPLSRFQGHLRACTGPALAVST